MAIASQAPDAIVSYCVPVSGKPGFRTRRRLQRRRPVPQRASLRAIHHPPAATLPRLHALTRSSRPPGGEFVRNLWTEALKMVGGLVLEEESQKILRKWREAASSRSFHPAPMMAAGV